MNWLQALQRRFRIYLDRNRRYTSLRVSDQPDSIAEGIVYLVGDSPQPWAATLKCPCGCGATISLSLIADDDPRWEVRSSGDAITLWPSIWRTKGCKSHFIVSDGKVYWAREAVRLPKARTG